MFWQIRVLIFFFIFFFQMGLRATLVKRHILHGTPGPSGRVFPVPGNLAVGLCPRSLVQRLEAAVRRGHRLVGGRHRGRRTIVIASTRNAPFDSGYESFQNATANPSTVRSLFELSGENCWHNNRGESFSWHVVLKSYDLTTRIQSLFGVAFKSEFNLSSSCHLDRALNDEFSVECLFWFFQPTWKADLKVVQITKKFFLS